MSEVEINPAQLPQSWGLTTLGAVVNYGSTAKAEPTEIADDDWVLELEDIEKDSSRLLQKMTFLQRQSKSTKNRFHAGDVLYGKLRPYLNKVLIADEPGYCTTEILPLKADAHLDNRYLFYWLKHPVFLKYVEAESHGMNMPRLGTDAGKAAPFVLAPRNEQTRIADQLDTLLTRIQSCNDRFDAIPALLKRFRQAVLDAAASGALTIDWRRLSKSNLAAWNEVTLQEVISEMRNGLAQKPIEHPPGAKILRIGAVRAGQLDLSDYRYLEVSDKEALQYELRKDDLLFTRYNGSLEFVGVCVALMQDAPNYVYPDKLIRVRTRNELVLPKFIEIAFGSRPIRQQVEGCVKSSSGQRGISGADLKGTRFKLASLDEQVEVVRRVEALFALADRIEARATAARVQAQRLSPLVLAKAFRGELVAQEPQDEPASELLARIAAQRAMPVANKQSTKAHRVRVARVKKESATMSKSRQDDDVKNKPYLADHLRRLGSATTVEVLFKASELPVADFYKQLAWEVAQGHIADSGTTLEANHATR